MRRFTHETTMSVFAILVLPQNEENIKINVEAMLT